MKRLLVVCIILLSQCREKRIFQENNENIYKKEGFSITLSKEYKKINEDENGVLFLGKSGDISVIFFKENVSQIKKFYEKYERFPLENCNAYLFTEKQRKGFKKIIKIRLEIFPNKKDIQITILCFELEKNYNKIIDILRTIKLEW